ncbi:DUF6567 family protein [Capnocytophaga stomatis]|uniref:DUF6567 family protein n=1 Tax=Capnocytophaga stomatis TaxID=1848904 RepID=A0ABW8Q8M3_9FLAO|nr:DUF6567 family protein [Capnocytophaga stomatis]GIJ93479.1 hypothetical protein CAPN002_06970 [Capnocytophaga stomatis]
MKKIVLLGVASLFLASCGFHKGLTRNVNNHTTEVVLSKKNFKVVERVKGEASDFYVLGFGGMKKALIEEARAEMLKKANLLDSSRAIVNETVEVHNSEFVLFSKYTVTVSANVIEFTE